MEKKESERFVFQFVLTEEQVQYGKELVRYANENHPVEDIYAYDFNSEEERKKKQKKYRMIGVFGEIAFAYVYNLDMPTRAYGAINGQDYGIDYVLNNCSIDVKSMNRKSGFFRLDYVFNIPVYQIEKIDSKTEYYYCVNIHKDKDEQVIATFVGCFSREKVLKGEIGKFFEKGEERIREDGTSFPFKRETYEIKFEDMENPEIPEDTSNLHGFKIIKLSKKYIPTNELVEFESK